MSVLWVILDLSVKHLYESYVPERKRDSSTKDGNHKMQWLRAATNTALKVRPTFDKDYMKTTSGQCGLRRSD